MAPEQSFHLPDKDVFLEGLKAFELKDDFGNRLLTLIAEIALLEKQGKLSGYAERLMAYEYTRRRKWFEGLISRTHDRFSGVPYHLLTISSLEKLHGPGKFIPWEGLEAIMKDKSVKYDKGSYRGIPTPAHIGYLLRGFECNWKEDTINVVIFEPKENIRQYKGDVPILPDDIRIELLRHIPSVHILTEAPNIVGQDVENFWKQTNRRFGSTAAGIEELGESFDHSYIKEKAWNFDTKKIDHVTVPYLDEPEYLNMRTSDWDCRCAGEDVFVSAAREILIEK